MDHILLDTENIAGLLDKCFCVPSESNRDGHRFYMVLEQKSEDIAAKIYKLTCPYNVCQRILKEHLRILWISNMNTVRKLKEMLENKVQGATLGIIHHLECENSS